MPLISKEEAFSEYLKTGSNSSHFVWFVAGLQFFKTTNAWIFGYCQVGKVTLFALEPLGFNDTRRQGEFQEAWQEVKEFFKPQISFFVSIYAPYMSLLKTVDFQILQVGKEPYVTLKDCVPTGNSGKGVRAARNQALRAGVCVEEWSKEEILAAPEIHESMKKLLKLWKDRNIINMGDFLNKVDPFAYMEHRRYFLAFSAKRELEAFLVTTPIPMKNSFFLEDMVIAPEAPRGVGELLTLETMVSLSESNFEKASLGVVSVMSIDKNSTFGLPPLAEFFMVKIPKLFSPLYNVAGLEIFRKRFKPSSWENIFLALKNEKSSGLSDSFAWFYALFSLLRCFNPRLNISFTWIKNLITEPLKKHPISYFTLFVSVLLFWLVNHGGTLPPHVLERYGFIAAAPVSQWIYRSIISDFLYFNLWHFLPSLIILISLLRWAEKTHRKNFLYAYTAILCVFDDIVDYIILVKPHEYFHPEVFKKLLTYPDVGGSMWLASFLGLQICQLRKNKELFFAISSVGFILYLVLQSARFSNLILNLDHFLFLSLGYITGRLKIEWEKKQSRKVCKQKPPEAKSVALRNQKNKGSQKDSARQNLTLE